MNEYSIFKNSQTVESFHNKQDVHILYKCTRWFYHLKYKDIQLSKYSGWSCNHLEGVEGLES